MVRVNQALSAQGYKSRLILQVHDELIVEAPHGEEAQSVAALVRREMEGVVALDVPLSADVSTGGNWYDCK